MPPTAMPPSRPGPSSPTPTPADRPAPPPPPQPPARDAHVEITLCSPDREPCGPYRVTVPARRTRHVRFNDLSDPQPIPKDTDFASVIESDVPIVARHTRLDSRQAENALLSTMAFAGDA